MRFLFVTTTNIASNPRLYKELLLCQECGNFSTILQFNLGNWSDLESISLRKKLTNSSFIDISAVRKPLLPWLFSMLLEKALSLLPLVLLGRRFLAFSFSRRSVLLLWELNKIKSKFDWVISHNPASFYPAYIFSRKTGSKFAIDFEDFHPGEFLYSKMGFRIQKIMKCVIPYSFYCSFASPLIKKAVSDSIGFTPPNSFVIINGFRESEFEYFIPRNENLKIVWYSQNIDFGRGLELFILSLQSFSGKIHLTLIGQLNVHFWNKFLKHQKYVDVLSPMSQSYLHIYLSKFDVGLASDIPILKNREYALTNKIITYAQAGLWIMATNTLSHIQFIQQFSLNSSICKYDLFEINKSFSFLLKIKNRLPAFRSRQFIKGKNLSWEKISTPLVSIWNS